MALDKEAPVIRIVKKGHGHGGHHGGAWKVAYADFVTAMMAFFLVMWILGLNKPLRESIAAYFRDPVGFMRTAHGGKSPLSAGEQQDIKKGALAPLIPQDGGRASLAQLQTLFKNVQEAILKEMAKRPEFKNLKDSVDVRLTEDGLRIELIEKTGSMFFDTGSAALKPHTVVLLQTIARELNKLNSPVVIEGHTDSRPLGRPGSYTNWELSSDRANAARRAMETHGLHPGQVIAVRGYADRKLLRPDDPFHFSNRRVSILVPYDKKGL